MTEDFNKLIEQADKVYKENFPPTTFFGRCIFVSWFCKIGTCTFCFRSAIKHKIKHSSSAKRSMASMLNDAIIGKRMGWEIEYITGGYGVFEFDELVEILKNISMIYERKLWINIGTITEEEMDKISPYVEGICGSIETAEEKLHNEVCPDKPIKPYSDMFKLAGKKGFKKSMTIVIGLGEKQENINMLFDFIEEHKLDRITFYALKPVQGSPFTKSPEPEYYAWWIAKTRIRFPKLEIIVGLTPRKVDYVETLLKAGANGITKFPAMKQFNTDNARMIENMAKKAGREFKGSLTHAVDIDIEKEAELLLKKGLDKTLVEQIKVKLKQSINRLNKIENPDDKDSDFDE